MYEHKHRLPNHWNDYKQSRLVNTMHCWLRTQLVVNAPAQANTTVRTNPYVPAQANVQVRTNLYAQNCENPECVSLNALMYNLDHFDLDVDIPAQDLP